MKKNYHTHVLLSLSLSFSLDYHFQLRLTIVTFWLRKIRMDGSLITFDPIKCFSFIKLAKRVGWRRLAADSQELLLLFGFEKPQHHVREIFSTCLKLSHFHPGEICIPPNKTTTTQNSKTCVCSRNPIYWIRRTHSMKGRKKGGVVKQIRYFLEIKSLP
jgi:hypothetical protein